MLAGGVSLPAIVQVSFTTQSPGSTEADTVALGLLEGQSLPDEAPGARTAIYLRRASSEGCSHRPAHFK